MHLFRVKNNTYIKGLLWFILSLLVNAVNDVIAKHVGLKLSSAQVSCFRFLFSAITLIPFILYFGLEHLKTKHYKIHFLRGLLLFLGITGWTYGLTKTPVSTVTIISFSIPIFVLMLASFFLSEKAKWYRWVVTLVEFLGISLALQPVGREINLGIPVLLLSAVAFAMLDIINKKFIIRESILSMLFYSAICTCFLSFPLAAYSWQAVTTTDLLLLFVLGSNANLILYCLLKSFALIDATATAPCRYLELIFSSILGFLVFAELPSTNVWYGMIILVLATIFLVYKEREQQLTNPGISNV